jgi:hypothetical protein
LLEYVRVSQQCSFHGVGFVLGLMMEDRGSDSVQLFKRESPVKKEFPAPLDGVWDVIPPGKLFRILRTVAKKDTEVMHPDSGKEDVVVVLHAFAYFGSQGIEPRLVAELVGGKRFGPDVIDHGGSPVAIH